MSESHIKPHQIIVQTSEAEGKALITILWKKDSLVLDDDLHLDGVHDDAVLAAEAVVLGGHLGDEGALGATHKLVGEGELVAGNDGTIF